MKKIATYIALTLLVTACVYPYDAEIDSGIYGDLVVEGDILLGAESHFTLSRLLPLTEETPDSLAEPVSADIMVESYSGETYRGIPEGDGVYLINTTAAPSDRAYRLRIKADNGEKYVSSWMRAEGACTIDNLKYDIEGDRLDVLLDMHSSYESRNFRYRYTEVWEYTAPVRAYVHYVLPTQECPDGYITNFQGGENTYYCWRTDRSHGINLASTQEMSSDTLTDYHILSYDNTNGKMAIQYRISLYVYPVDSDSYAYYEHLKEISTYNGSLFSPIPSELRGNIRCESDTTRTAYGYVAAVNASSFTLDIPTGKLDFYQHSPINIKTYKNMWYDLYNAYLHGYAPLEDDPMSGIIWTDRRCVDCTMLGGTKEKPADWPTDHI